MDAAQQGREDEMRSARQVPNARVEQVVNAQFLVWGSGGGTTDNAQRATHLVLQTLEQEFLAFSSRVAET